MVVEDRIRIEDVVVNYAKEGNGPSNILCLPDVLGSWDLHFKRFLRDVDGNRFTVVALDPVGYGKSRPPSRHDWVTRAELRQYNQMDAEYAHRVMKTLGLLPYSILGWGEGGVTAMFQAAQEPTHVEKLVLWGCSAYVTDFELKTYEQIRNIGTMATRMVEKYLDFYGETYTKECWTDYIDFLIESKRERGGNKCRQLADKLSLPILVFFGKEGMRVSRSSVEYLEDTFKAEVLPHPKGQHDLHNQFPKWFCKEVQRFIAPTEKELSSGSD